MRTSRAPRLPIFLAVYLVGLEFPSGAAAQPSALRYRFQEGESFGSSTSVTCRGTIAAATDPAPFRLEGRVMRRYRVARIESDRTAVLVSEVDSVSVDVSVGGESIRMLLTNKLMEMNGRVIWRPENGPPGRLAAPFLLPDAFRLDPFGRRIASLPEQWQRIPVQPQEDMKEGHRVASDLVSLFVGDREPFPPFPEKEIAEGAAWSVRMPLTLTPEGAPAVIREGTYSVHQPEASVGAAVEIRGTERTTMENTSVIRVRDLIRKPVPTSPEPTPRAIDRENVLVERMVREGAGRYLFDTAAGRPLAADLAGTADIRAVMVRHYDPITDTIPLVYSLSVEVQVRFEYPSPEGG